MESTTRCFLLNNEHTLCILSLRQLCLSSRDIITLSKYYCLSSKHKWIHKKDEHRGASITFKIQHTSRKKDCLLFRIMVIMLVRFFKERVGLFLSLHVRAWGDFQTHSLLDSDKASFSPLKYRSNKSFFDVQEKDVFQNWISRELDSHNNIEVLWISNGWMVQQVS